MSHRMRRLLRLPAALFVLACLSAPGVSRAALVTDVADAADGDDPLDVNLQLKWERTQRKTKITREVVDEVQQRTINATELRHTRWTHTLTPSIAIGLFHDLEIHASVPYALHDEQFWDFAEVDGSSVEPVSSLKGNTFDADGKCFDAGCTATRPLMPVPGRVFRGGFLDPTIGIAWGLFNHEREKKLPESWFPHKVRTATWVLGFDYTMPIIDPADPTKADPSTPMPNVTLPLGTGAHRFDWWMAMSKRVGIVEPFMKLHYTLPVTSDQAYDNCEVAGSDADRMVMSSVGQAQCAPNNPDTFWRGKTGTEFPHVGGILVGAELIPVEEPTGLRLAIALQVGANYVSKGRRFTEVSDGLGKLTYSDQYFTIDSRLTFDLRVSKWVHFVTAVSLATDTPHFLTSESVGKDRYGETPSDPPDNEVTLDSPEMNPNYDPRIDAPGTRMRATDVSIFAVSAMLEVNF